MPQIPFTPLVLAFGHVDDLVAETHRVERTRPLDPGETERLKALFALAEVLREDALRERQRGAAEPFSLAFARSEPLFSAAGLSPAQALWQVIGGFMSCLVGITQATPGTPGFRHRLAQLHTLIDCTELLKEAAQGGLSPALAARIDKSIEAAREALADELPAIVATAAEIAMATAAGQA